MLRAARFRRLGPAAEIHYGEQAEGSAVAVMPAAETMSGAPSVRSFDTANAETAATARGEPMEEMAPMTSEGDAKAVDSGQQTLHAQQARAEQFRQWHRGPPILVLPNAWDAASARIFAQLGFRAIATTSSGIAAALGYPDGEQMSRDEMIGAVARIAAAADGRPVSADIEAGYGATEVAKLQTIRAVVEAGAVGINIEDGARRATAGSPPLVDLADQVALIQAIRGASSEWDVPLVINARTDLYLSPAEDEGQRFAETVRRGNAYLDAGADCVFPIGASEATTIGDLARAIHGPINVLAGPHTPNVAELARLGVARVSVGGGLTRVALGAARRAAQELLEHGTFTTMAQEALPSAGFRHLFAR